MGSPLYKPSDTLDTVMISAGTKSMGGGTVASIIGFMSSNGFAVLIGVLVTILGFICSVYFQRRQHLRNREKWDLEKQQMLTEERRREEIHQATLRKLRYDQDSDQEC